MSLVLLDNPQYNRFMDDLVINANLTIPLKEISISFARSGGPGGQHVNKVETKVEARWSVLNSDSLTEENRAWLLKKLANRLTNTGDLVITLRPGPDKKGWEVLYRVGNRPLGTRAWRKVDYRDSLSGTIAAALVELSSPSRRDRFLNLMCGSGAIMIERLKRGGASSVVGVDISSTALTASKQNCEAAGSIGQILLVKGDARRLPFEDGGFDKLCVDLPWGESIGTRESNVSLYKDTF